MDRRAFLEFLAGLGLFSRLAPDLTGATAAAPGRARGPIQARYWRPREDGTVECHLCPHQEVLGPGQTGHCHVRTNQGGRLVTAATGQPCVVNLDPIEKNPLAHVWPGTTVLAVAHAGCNLHCPYCQNWQFSQKSPAETRNIPFNQDEALDLARRKTLRAVSFTYTEGVCHIEFNRRLAEAARDAGLGTLLCTGGCVLPEPMADFLDVLDAVTVTLKGFSDAFYRDRIGAPALKPILNTCEQVRRSGKWLEIATLVCPGLNDSERELASMARWIRANLGADTPWHIERFNPQYKMLNTPQTPLPSLERAREIGFEQGLRHVYLCNVAPHDGNHTYCARCHQPVIKRLGFKLLTDSTRAGVCPNCQTALPGLWV